MSHRRAVVERTRLPDGRELDFEVSGPTAGWPVVLIHGMPGSRVGPKPGGAELERLGIRLIAYDRPGYGASTRQPGRTVADAAADVAHIADHLGIERFSVIGRSGGGPHALACAALLAGRVPRAAVLVGIAPADATDVAWTQGMTADNVAVYQAADGDIDGLIDVISARAERTAQDPETLVEALLKEMAEADRAIVTVAKIRRQLTESYRIGLAHGYGGWLDDIRALRSPWGFDLGIIQGSVLLWHGIHDVFTPVQHAYWLGRHISDVQMVIDQNAGHFGALTVLSDTLRWLRCDVSHWQVTPG
jgi:pimeloyl-ACP methyl ester carboxylesterase